MFHRAAPWPCGEQCKEREDWRRNNASPTESEASPMASLGDIVSLLPTKARRSSSPAGATSTSISMTSNGASPSANLVRALGAPGRPWAPILDLQGLPQLPLWNPCSRAALYYGACCCLTTMASIDCQSCPLGPSLQSIRT